MRDTGTAILALVLGVFAATHAHAQENLRTDPVPLDTISITTREGTLLSLDVSRDGRTIVFDLLGQLWSLDARGGEASAVTDAVRDTAEDGDPSLSPDGTRVVFSGERGGRRGLWMVDLPGGVPRLLSQTAIADGFDGQGAWSPDGRTVAFSRAVVRIEGEAVAGWSELALVECSTVAPHRRAAGARRPGSCVVAGWLADRVRRRLGARRRRRARVERSGRRRRGRAAHARGRPGARARLLSGRRSARLSRSRLCG
jgi:dipeptidyl aminopeptidase/acylaminoacyl peptidase